MAVKGSRGTSSLFTPLYVVDVLIPNEVVQYNERLHWASLIQTFAETIAYLILITIFTPGGLPNGGFGVLLALVAIITFGVLWWQKKLTKRMLIFVAVGVAIGFVTVGYQMLAILLIIGVFGRFFYRFNDVGVLREAVHHQPSGH